MNTDPPPIRIFLRGDNPTFIGLPRPSRSFFRNNDLGRRRALEQPSNPFWQDGWHGFFDLGPTVEPVSRNSVLSGRVVVYPLLTTHYPLVDWGERLTAHRVRYGVCAADQTDPGRFWVQRRAR